MFAFQIEGVKHEFQNKESILERTIEIAEALLSGSLKAIDFSHSKKELDAP